MPTASLENDWIGHTLAVGDRVSLPVTVADPRCVMITLAQGDLPKDPGILRAAAQHNRVEIPGSGLYPCVGVYATVAAGGSVRRGDPVALDLSTGAAALLRGRGVPRQPRQTRSKTGATTSGAPAITFAAPAPLRPRRRH